MTRYDVRFSHNTCATDGCYYYYLGIVERVSIREQGVCGGLWQVRLYGW